MSRTGAFQAIATSRGRWLLLAGLLVANALVAASIYTAIAQYNERVAAARFGSVVDRVSLQLDRQMAIFEYGLRGARGAIVAAGGDKATLDEFHAYALTRDPPKEFPGAMGFGFIRRVRAAEAPDFVARERATGRPGFAIRQLTPQPGERFVIDFVEPEAPNAKAIGLDIASQPTRRSAALASMESGRATLTAPLELVQSAGVGARGFLLLLPVYRPGAAIATPQERREAAIGWTYAPLLIDNVLAGLGSLGGELGFSLADTSVPQKSFYVQHESPASSDPALTADRTFPLYGRTWLMKAWALPPFVQSLNLTSPLAAALLCILSLAVLEVLLAILLAYRARRDQISIEQARMAAIVEGSNDAIIGKTLDGVVTSWNGAAERLFGYPASEAIGRTMADLLIPDRLKSEEERILAEIGAGRPVLHFRTVRVTRAGVELDMLVSISPIVSPDGALVGAATVVRDISADLAAERRIRELNASLERQVEERTAQLSAVIDNVPAVIGYWNRDMRNVLANRAFLTWYGKHPTAIFGKHIRDVIGDEMFERNRHYFEGALRGEPQHFERRVLTPEAGERFGLASYVPDIRGGETIGFYALVVDITDQKLAEADRERARLQVEEARVAAEEARRIAEQANAAKTEFLASMSHELRTPLNSIVGFSALLLEESGEASAEAHRHARIVHDSSRTLLSIVNDILDVSKIEASSLELDPQPFAPRDLVRSTIDLMRSQADAKGLALDVDVAGDLPRRLVGDDARLRQVLLNLLANALKFTAKGEVLVSVRVVGRESDRIMLRFSVADTGIGIPESHRHRLFRRFSQADSSTSRRYGGTGLGLAICKSLVELMGGAIGVESIEGCGSTFWFTVPLIEGSAADDVRKRDVEDEGAEFVGSLSILLAEDVPVNQELAVTLLRKWGHRADVVEDGVAALHAIQGDGYDLILMDIHMPTMDGVEATRRIRALGGRAAQVPIIAMSANVFDSDIEAFNAVGMDDHIGKPFAPRELKRKIARWGKVRATTPDGHVGPSPETSRETWRASAEAPSNVLDREVFEEFTAMIGEERAQELIQTFADDLSARFAVASVADVLCKDAHAIASSAGAVGFLRLSAAAKALERAINDGSSPSRLLDTVLGERDAARSAIAGLSSRRAKAS